MVKRGEKRSQRHELEKTVAVTTLFISVLLTGCGSDARTAGEDSDTYYVGMRHI
jgi:hypothetical protein